MKKFLVLSLLLLLTAFILLPASGSGKYNVSKPALGQGRLVADGGPMPPPFPPNPSLTLVADGGPMPQPFPPNPSLLVAVV